MELVKSLSMEAVPKATQVLRFALTSALESFRSLVLLYPLNLLLLLGGTLWLFYRLCLWVLPRGRFKANYLLQPHQEHSAEELKVLKREVRELQVQILEMAKERAGQDGAKGREDGARGREEAGRGREDEGVGRVVESFLEEEREKEELLSLVEEELKATVVAAYQEIAKVRSY